MLNFEQKTPSFRPRDYRIKQGRGKYRTIDNGALAKEWLAFLGHSDETLRGGLKLFDNDRLYRRAFLIHPNNNYWRQLKKTIGSCPPVQSDSNFEEGSPSIAQYLLAHTIANFVKQRRVSFQKNRLKAIERLAKRRIIKTDNAGNPIEDPYTVDSKLYKDDEYFLGIVVNNMQDIIIELYAMILVMKYNSLEDQTCVKLLKYPPIRLLVEDPYSDIKTNDSKANTKHILIPIYEFIKFSMGQFILKYGEVIKAKPRLKSYLAQRGTVDMIRGFLIEVNEDKVPKWVDDWCPGKGTFVSELPDIQ